MSLWDAISYINTKANFTIREKKKKHYLPEKKNIECT